MAIYTDQTGKSISLSTIPTRIISLVPSQTELLYDLGLDKQVIAITKFCVHPKEWHRDKTNIGGTKSVIIKKIKALHPDLIIANKEENIKEQVDELSTHYPAWISDISNLQEALRMIHSIGLITDTLEKAEAMIETIEMRFARVPKINGAIRTAYLIWQNPYMTAGSDTFIHDMLARCGFENIFNDQTRYPTVTIEEIKNRRCELLLLSSEPFPFKQKHAEALQTQLPSTKIILVDGEMFSWYGSRMLHAPEYFNALQKKYIFD
ncbi:MAG: helical backbone metal receptor [Bacteroidota bacterium]